MRTTLLVLIVGLLWPLRVEAQLTACNQTAIVDAITASGAGAGSTITFDCTDTIINFTVKLGTFGNDVILDGEAKNITINYSGSLSGCTPGDNGIGAPEIADLNTEGAAIKNLSFTNWLESLQIQGPDTTVEGNTFTAHNCSDDAISVNDVAALNTTIRGNTIIGYTDKAVQMSFGSGLIELNTMTDNNAPFRGPFDNGTTLLWTIQDNVVGHSGDVNDCGGDHINGTYYVLYQRNTHTCLRGTRFGGNVQAIVRNNTFASNPRGGFQASDDAIISFQGNTVTGNGTSAGSEPAGGLVVMENAVVDAGGGSLSIGGATVVSTGGNTLTGNGVADLNNDNGVVTIKAENNCWDHDTVGEVEATDIDGLVDVDPLGSCGVAGAPVRLRLR